MNTYVKSQLYDSLFRKYGQKGKVEHWSPMSEDGVVETRHNYPPPNETNKHEEEYLKGMSSQVSHTLWLGNDTVKEYRFQFNRRQCYITDYMMKHLTTQDVIGMAENLMRTRSDYLMDISKGYRKMEGRIGYYFAINMIRAMVSEDLELIEWEYENFSPTNAWAKPREHRTGDGANVTRIYVPIQEFMDAVPKSDWLFSHRLFSCEKRGWWEGFARLYRQRVTFGKEVKKPANWNINQFLTEIRQNREPLTEVEENIPSPNEMVCSFLGCIEKNEAYREVQVRYTNDMLDYEVSDYDELLDKVKAEAMKKQLSSAHYHLWVAVQTGVHVSNVKYVYAMLKKGPAAVERFEDENTHKRNIEWNHPGPLCNFYRFFRNALHFETSTPVPMTERRNPLVVQSGLDFMNKFINGSLQPGSSEPSFSCQPLTESDLYPSESHATGGEHKKESEKTESVDSVPEREPEEGPAEQVSEMESMEQLSEVESVGSGADDKSTENKAEEKSVPSKPAAEKVSTNQTTKKGAKKTAAKNVPKKNAGKSQSKPMASERGKPQESQAPTVLPMEKLTQNTNSKGAQIAAVPVVEEPVANVNQVTKEVTMTKKAEEVEPVKLITKPALSYAKVVKNTASNNGNFEEMDNASKSSQSSLKTQDSMSTNESNMDRPIDDDDGSEWTQVVSKSSEHRSQKKPSDDKTTFQSSTTAAVSRKKVLKSLDSKDTDDTSSNSSSSVDIKSPNGNGKKSQPTSTNGGISPLNGINKTSNTSETSTKSGKTAWALPPASKNGDVVPDSPVASQDAPQPPKMTQTAIKKAKKAEKAAAAQRLLESMKSSSTETTPTTTEKLVMVADDNTVTEADFEVKVKEKTPKTEPPRKNKNKKGGKGKSSMSGSSSRSSPAKEEKKHLTTVEAHFMDKTATAIIQEALGLLWENAGLSQVRLPYNQDPNQPGPSARIPRAEPDGDDGGNSSNHHAGLPIVHDYRPGYGNDNAGESPPVSRDASPERHGGQEEAIVNNNNRPDEPVVNVNRPDDPAINDVIPDAPVVQDNGPQVPADGPEVPAVPDNREGDDPEDEVALANPNLPIIEKASNPILHDHFMQMKEYSDNKKARSDGFARGNRRVLRLRVEKFDHSYLFRLRISKAMNHILAASAIVEAATRREDSVTRLLMAFMVEPLEAKNSLRGQQLDNLVHYTNAEESVLTMKGLRFIDLRLAELAHDNEIRDRYQAICDRVAAVMDVQEVFYRLIPKMPNGTLNMNL